MLAHEDSRIQDRKLILWARFHPEFSRNVLIPEIEANSIQYHVDPQLVDNFRKCRNAENCLYFLHGYAYADIPAGQEYDLMMRINKEFRPQPIAYAWHGYHADCLLQFRDGIPDMIQELYEINQKKPIEIRQEVCLCSDDTLKAIINSSSTANQ